MCYELLDACSNMVRIIGAKICGYTVSNITLWMPFHLDFISECGRGRGQIYCQTFSGRNKVEPLWGNLVMEKVPVF